MGTAQGVLVYGTIGNQLVAPPALYGVGAPSNSKPGILGQNYFDSSVSPRVGYVWTGAEWSTDASTGGSFTTLTVTGLSTLGATTIVGTTLINASGAAATTIGTGGTGAVNIGNATGNTLITGDLVVTETITATLGNITATNGNLVLGTAGNKISIATGENASVGTSGAMVGGAVTVNTTAVTASSIIFAVPAVLGTVTAPQAYYISAKVAATSFTITSADATDTSTWNYWIIN